MAFCDGCLQWLAIGPETQGKCPRPGPRCSAEAFIDNRMWQRCTLNLGHEGEHKMPGFVPPDTCIGRPYEDDDPPAFLWQCEGCGRYVEPDHGVNGGGHRLVADDGVTAVLCGPVTRRVEL